MSKRPDMLGDKNPMRDPEIAEKMASAQRGKPKLASRGPRPKLSEYLKKNGTWWERMGKTNPILTAEAKVQYSQRMKELWKDPTYRARMSMFTRPYRVEYETKVLNILKESSEFEFVERAETVCDFVAIKDGRIILIEAKQPNPKRARNRLKPNQKRAKDLLLSEEYRVIDYEGNPLE